MLQKFRQAVGRAFGRKVVSVASLFDGLGANVLSLSELRNYESYLQAACKKVWATWKSCDLVAGVVSTTAYVITKKGGTEPVKVPDLERLLKVPNPNTTGEELIYLLAFWAKAVGNAYVYKSEAIEGECPRELHPLNPKRMRILVNEAGKRYGYAYHNGVREILFDLEEIIHFKLPHPNNDFYGIGDMEAGEELLQDFINRTTWAKKFWSNGAAPTSIMTLKGDGAPDQQTWTELKRKYMLEYGGQSNAGKTAFLNGDWSVHKIGLSAQEMQEMERIQLTTNQIFQLHGIPLSVAGIEAAANYATAQQDELNFRKYTVMKIARMIEDTLQTDLVEGFGDYQFRFNLSGLIDLQAVITFFAPLFDRGGLTPNEMREKAGLPRVKNPMLDAFYLSSTYVPIELAGVANMDQVEDDAKRVHDRFNRQLLNADATAS